MWKGDQSTPFSITMGMCLPLLHVKSEGLAISEDFWEPDQPQFHNLKPPHSRQFFFK